MSAFWLWSVVLAVAAAGFVLWPLFRSRSTAAQAQERDQVVLELYSQHQQEFASQRDAGEIDQEQYQQLQQENERALLEDTAVATGTDFKAGGRRLLLAVAVILPLLALGLYWERGAQDDLAIQQLAQQLFSSRVESEADRQRLIAMSDELKQKIEGRLKRQPDNVQYWYMLARMNVAEGSYAKSIEAYEAILKVEPASPKILAELAQVHFLQSENQVTPLVSGLIAQALAQNAEEPTALGLAGIEAYQLAQYQRAIDYWQQAIAQMGPMAPGAQSLQAGIDQASRLLAEGSEQVLAEGGEQAPTAESGADQVVGTEAAADQPAGAANNGVSLVVKVTLAEGVDAQADHDVFIYARAWQGPKMPLAIAKLKVADLPATVTLDDSMSMMAGMTLSSFAEVEVVARISRDGDPIARPGDWQAAVGPIKVKDEAGAVLPQELRQELSLEINAKL